MWRASPQCYQIVRYAGSLITLFTDLVLLQHHCSIFSARIFWKRNSKPLMILRSFPFSLLITLSTFFGLTFPPNWYTTVITKTDSGTHITPWSSAAWNALPLSEHWPPDATSKLRVWTTRRILPLGQQEWVRNAWFTNRLRPHILVQWISRMNGGKISSGTMASGHFRW